MFAVGARRNGKLPFRIGNGDQPAPRGEHEPHQEELRPRDTVLSPESRVFQIIGGVGGSINFKHLGLA